MNLNVFLLCLLVFSVKVTCDILKISGNVKLYLASEAQQYLCRDIYYYFRCTVMRSSELVWHIDETIITIPASSSVMYFANQYPYHAVLAKKDVSTIETDTNFTSYLWFNSSVLSNITQMLNVTCEGLDIILQKPDAITAPHTIVVNSYYNKSSEEIIVLCEWQYDNLSAVAFFLVEIIEQDTVIDSKTVLGQNLLQYFVIRNTTKTNFSVTVTTFGHCNDSMPSSKTFIPDAYIFCQEVDEGDECHYSVVAGVCSVVIFMAAVYILLSIIIFGMITKVARRERDDARRERDDARRECDDARRECDNARRERDNVQRERDDARRECDNLQRERDNARRECDNVQRECANSQGELSDARRESMESQQQLQNARQRVRDTKAQLQERDSEVIRIREECERQVTELNMKLNTLKERLKKPEEILQKPNPKSSRKKPPPPYYAEYQSTSLAPNARPFAAAPAKGIQSERKDIVREKIIIQNSKRQSQIDSQPSDSMPHSDCKPQRTGTINVQKLKKVFEPDEESV